MADLTQQDKDNYAKLRSAAKTLREAISKLGEQPQHKLLKGLVNALLAETEFPASLNPIEELESRLDRVDGYLISQRLLLTSLEANNQAEIATATQELLNLSALIKASLQDIDDADLSTLDDSTPPCTDALFLKFIEGDATTWTQKLLDGYLPNLTSNQIQQLTDAWGTAVYKVTEDARKKGENDGKLTPGKPNTIFRFFCIHEELEALYDRLSTLVA